MKSMNSFDYVALVLVTPTYLVMCFIQIYFLQDASKNITSILSGHFPVAYVNLAAILTAAPFAFLFAAPRRWDKKYPCHSHREGASFLWQSSPKQRCSEQANSQIPSYSHQVTTNDSSLAQGCCSLFFQGRHFGKGTFLNNGLQHLSSRECSLFNEVLSSVQAG